MHTLATRPDLSARRLPISRQRARCALGSGTEQSDANGARRLRPGLDVAAQAATIVAGGVGFLYVVGGALLLVRFNNAHVPAGRAVALVEGPRLVQTGLTGVFGPALWRWSSAS
jgi:hypothetical protein